MLSNINTFVMKYLFATIDRIKKNEILICKQEVRNKL